MVQQFFNRTAAWVTFAIIFMALGTTAELLLLSHYEDSWQVLPIVLINLTLPFALIIIWKRGKLAIRLFKVLLLSCALSGVLGIYFHLNANLEFEAELHPSQTFSTTFIESLSGALPTLAPGSMMVFALLGYIQILIYKQYNNDSLN